MFKNVSLRTSSPLCARMGYAPDSTLGEGNHTMQKPDPEAAVQRVSFGNFDMNWR